MRTNKEKTGEAIRFSIRIPAYQHIWLKNRSTKSKVEDEFESMNSIIVEAIDHYMGLI